MKIFTPASMYLLIRWFFPFVLITIFSINGFSQNGVAINTTGTVANSSAMLDITSTSRGLLIPRMTQAQRLIIPVAASTDGLMVYQTDNQINSPAGFYYYSSITSAWSSISPASGNGNFILNQNSVVQTPGTFNIAGSGSMVGIANTNTLISSGGAISLNNNSNFLTNINTGSTGTVSIGGTGAGPQSINVGTGFTTVSPGVNIINIGTGITGNGTNNINIGSNAEGLATNIIGGGSGVNINNNNAARATNISTGSSTGTLTLGSSTTTNTVNILSGISTGVFNINKNNNSPTNINTGTSTGAVTIGGASGQTITVGGTGTQTINVGTSIAGSSVINIGNSSSDPLTTNIFSGAFNGTSGGLSINSNINKNLTTNINTGATTGNITIGSTSNNLFLPKFSTPGTILYSSAVTGQIAATASGSNGNILTLNAGIPTWAAPATNGTVTTFTSGGLFPLFTTSVTNPNTTPALSFTLSNANATSVFGNFTNGSAIPSFNSASADGQFLIRRSGTLTFGNIISSDLPSGNSSYIQNQSGPSSQTAKFWINGSASIGTSAFNTSNQLDIATAFASNNALVATNTTAAGSGIGDGIEGITSQSGGYGVWGINKNINGNGIVGQNLASVNTGSGDGVDGFTNQSLGFGVYGENDFTSTGGVAVAGAQVGTAIPALIYSPQAGAGASFTGNGSNTSTSTIIGVAGYANYGSSSPANGTFSGGYFATDISSGTPNTYAYVAASIAGTQYKITGTGTVSTIVNDLKNDPVTMYCPEAAEILLQDYGSGKLLSGRVHIILDPVFAKNIIINQKHQLRVIVTLNDDCNGVYVTNRTKTGFDVVELQNGKSNASFTYEIIANRADEYSTTGSLISKNADLRFSPAPKALLTNVKPIDKMKKQPGSSKTLSTTIKK